MYGSRLDLVGQLITDMGGKYESYDRSVKLTNGGVLIKYSDLKGVHLGSYLFNKVVVWAKELGSSYRVRPITLSRVDATKDNKERRNLFYENFGIRFNYRAAADIEKAEGASDPSVVTGDLIPRPTLSGIERSRQFDGLMQLGYQFDRLRDKAIGNRRLASVYRKKMRRIDWYFRTFASFLNWPAYMFIALVAFGIGRTIG